MRAQRYSLSCLLLLALGAGSCVLDDFRRCKTDGDCESDEFCQREEGYCLLAAPPGPDAQSFPDTQPFADAPFPLVETSCANGLDDDGDGLVDCLDPNCNSLSCGEGSRVCHEGVCDCLLVTEIYCDDGQDDDCDNMVDCQDPECQLNHPGCQTPETCQDGTDNDGDGQIDCADPDCDGQRCGSGTQTCREGLCHCSTGSLVETSCDNGEDDDCDLAIDCGDPDCLGSPSCVGVEICYDRQDNDGDGLIDCADPSCEGQLCSAGFMVCLSRACQCPSGASAETACSDGLDDDCDVAIDCADSDCFTHPDCSQERLCNDQEDNDDDGLIDCADPDCEALSCGPNGLICQAGLCLCSYGQTTEISCTDGLDSDCDGQTDCSDADCWADPACAGQEVCHDGLDNDGDGLLDCADPECEGQGCGPHGLICRGGTCLCDHGHRNESNCANQIDDDCDGAVDCLDTDCRSNPSCLGIEICDDGLDNDGDRMADCADDECDGLSCGPGGALCQRGVCGLATCNSSLPGYCLIAPDTFTMGSPPSELGREADEVQHRVTLTRAFHLKATEVTQQEWIAVFGDHPSAWRDCGEDCPVEQVNWWDTTAYCNELSRAEGLPLCYEYDFCQNEPGWGYACSGVELTGLDCPGYRLPTEAEWEFAARAGTESAFYTGGISSPECDPLDPTLDRAGWYCANSWWGPQRVARKEPNAWGLYDMSGNVWEWVQDTHVPYPTGLVFDPLGSSGPPIFKIRRGGSWNKEAKRSRSANRMNGWPYEYYFDLGFRTARTDI